LVVKRCFEYSGALSESLSRLLGRSTSSKVVKRCLVSSEALCRSISLVYLLDFALYDAE
jgi:hypothetical protein